MRTGEGLVPQWRRAMAAGGLLGVAVLAVPALVATAIGLGGGVGAVTEGLAAVATGPSEQAPSDVINPADSPERSASKLAERTAAPQSAVSERVSGGDNGGGDPGGATEVGSPGGTAVPPAPSSDPGSAPEPQAPGYESPVLPEPPAVEGTDGGVGGGLLDGLGESVNGLLGR
jgi:hypothetical protein